MHFSPLRIFFEPRGPRKGPEELERGWLEGAGRTPKGLGSGHRTRKRAPPGPTEKRSDSSKKGRNAKRKLAWMTY